MKKFFEKIHHKKEFITFYFELFEQEKEAMDVYMRNYTRYNRKWEMKLPVEQKLKWFIKKFGLKEQPAVLSYWCFEKEERYVFLRAMKKMK